MNEAQIYMLIIVCFAKKGKQKIRKLALRTNYCRAEVMNSKFLDFIEKIKVSKICLFVCMRAKN